MPKLKVAHDLEKKWRSNDVLLRGDIDFSALLLSERMLDGLKKAGFKKPSPIQAKAIPCCRYGYDTMVQAKSGTGKTLVFAVAALEMLMRKLFRPQVMVIAPTREIATQICSVVKAIASTFPKLTCESFIGGLPLVEDKAKALTTQIVVGTPGRLKQLIELQALPTNSIRLLVFDEADELLDSNSFQEDIDEIFLALPVLKQVIATSATFSPKVKKTLRRYMIDTAKYLDLNSKELALLGIIHYAEVVEFCPLPVMQYTYKLQVLKKILKTIKFSQCLMFCNGIQRVEVLHRDLKEWGFSSAYISSAKEQTDRLKAIDRLKRFKCKVLVSSDLTSRGIDAENVDLVINFDLAYKSEVYMHRVGRAGRYGSVGVAISIVQKNELKQLERLERDACFKVFKLPDPVPRDLILNPIKENFIIDSDSEDVQSSEKFKNTKFTNDFLKNNDHHSEVVVNAENIQDHSEVVNAENIQDHSEVANVENIQIKDHSETNINNEVPSKSPTQVTSNGIKLLDGITKLNAECEKEKVDEDDSFHSKNESIKTVYFNEEVTGKGLQNEYIVNNNMKLDKDKDPDLLNDYDQNKLSSIESTIAADTSENYIDLCDKNVFEKQDMIKDNIDNNVELNSQFSNVSDNLQKNDFEADGKKLNDIQIENVPASLEVKDVIENTDVDSVKCKQENNNESGNNLANMIKTFVDTYELNKKGESPKSNITMDSQPNENSDKKIITIDMINTLKSQKNDFFYKTFKKFYDDKDGGSVASDNKKGDEMEEIHEDINLLPENKKKSMTDLVFEQIDIIFEKLDNGEIKLRKSSEFKHRKDFLKKPNFESTPQVNDEIKQKNAKVTSGAAFCHSLFPNKPIHPFQGLFHDSDSSEYEKTNEIENSSVDSVQDSSSSESEWDSSSSDSESYSSSSDSSEDSDSETNSSRFHSKSESCSDCSASCSEKDNENSYRHNYYRTGRQNPSLVSDSSRNRMHHVPGMYFPNHNCSCVCTAIRNMPPLNTIRSEMPRGMCGDRRHRFVDPNVFMPFNHREDMACFRRVASCRGNSCSTRMLQASCRQQNFAHHSGAESYSRRNHSRCRRSKNLSKNVAQDEDQRASKDRTHPRSSRHHHHHTLKCYLPSEHRCHPNTPEYPCTRRSACETWYKIFYNQWLHIQNVIHC